MTNYKFAILGFPTSERKAALKEELSNLIEGFGHEVQSDVTILESNQLDQLGQGDSIAAVYFWNENQSDFDEISRQLDDNVIIIPIFYSEADLSSEKFEKIPDRLRKTMGVILEHEIDIKEIASSMLECAGLLSQKRKIFISYVHKDPKSKAIALQLHKIFTNRHFEVFLDLHRLHYGDKIKEFLSHNIIESDILVALDSEDYLTRSMTKHEFNLAKTRNISILHLKLPHEKSQDTSGLDTRGVFSEIEHIYEVNDISLSDEGCLRDDKVDEILSQIQLLRCKSVFNQHKFMSGKIRTEIKQMGMDYLGRGAYFSIEGCTEEGKNCVFIPIVGMPSIESMKVVTHRAENIVEDCDYVLKFDSNGFTDKFQHQLSWLNQQMAQLEVSEIIK